MNEQKVMKCPVCKGEVEAGAKKCQHCGSYIAIEWKIWGTFKSILYIATLIAAFVVLYFMGQGNLIMQYSVEEVRRSVDQGREALELTKESVAKIDTGFALTREQIRIQQEQLNLQRKSVEELSKEFIEEKRPRIEIATTKIDLTDTGSVLWVDFYNKGFADAEDILITFVLKYQEAPKDTLAFDLVRVSKITKVQVQTQSWTLGILKSVDLICLIDVRYTWRLQELHYQENKFFRYIYNEEEEKYSIRVLTEKQVEKLWE